MIVAADVSTRNSTQYSSSSWYSSSSSLCETAHLSNQEEPIFASFCFENKIKEEKVESETRYLGWGMLSRRES